MSWNSIDSFQLTKQFLCCTPIQKLILMNKTCEQIDIDVQNEILSNTVNNKLVKQYPIKRTYQRAFLKLFIEKIESAGNEIYDDLYVTYCNILSLPDKGDFHYRHFAIQDNGVIDYITLQESVNIVSNGTTGLCSWQAALGLAEWCAKNKDMLKGKKVLELGCGVGLSGLAIVKTCSPKMYIFSDYHPAVLDLLSKNVKLNLSDKFMETNNSDKLHLQMEHNETIVKIQDLKWEDVQDYLAQTLLVPDIIVAADILYESSCFDALTNALKLILSKGCESAIIVATIRNEDTVSAFLCQLGDYSLIFEECLVPEQTISVQFSDEPIKVYRISLKT